MSTQSATIEVAAPTGASSQPEPFLPFYERGRRGSVMPLSRRLSAVVLLGVLFLGLHYTSTNGGVFGDLSWMVALMLTVAPLSLYYATRTLRRLIPQLRRKLKKGGDRSYEDHLRGTLGDRSLLRSGLIFGVLNCVMGFTFQPGYEGIAPNVTYFSGLFVLGFVCGIAACGIYGVVRLIGEFARTGILIDYTAPDRCGGFHFLGEAIVKFASVTLLMGVLIATYILNAPWTEPVGRDVVMLMWFWAAFPFLLSVAVLLWPALSVHEALHEHKIRKEEKIQRHLSRLRTQLAGDALTKEERETASKRYEYVTKLRVELHGMRTWPFSLTQGAEYAGMLIGNGLISLPGVSKLLKLTGIERLPFG